MILLFYGPDDYRREAARWAAEARLAVGGVLARFDMESPEALPALAEFLSSQSLFGGGKIAVLEHPFAIATKECAALLKRGAEDDAATLMISSDKKPDSPFAFLAKQARAEKFDFLSGKEWTSFVAEEAKRRGAKCSPAVLSLLARAYEGDTWGLATELDKLASYPQAIGEEHVSARDPALAPDFWSLVNALKAPRVADRLSAFERLHAGGETAQKVFHMLAYFWPGRLPAFAAYDMLVKSGKMDCEEALLDAVLSA